MPRAFRTFPILIILALAVTPPAAAAGETIGGPVPAVVERVVDGDTLAVRVRIWLGQELAVLVRVRGMDAPELRGRCAEESRRARLAYQRAAEAVATGGVLLSRIEGDKYHGRILADVRLEDGRDLAAVMIGSGLARGYGGGARASWCGG